MLVLLKKNSLEDFFGSLCSKISEAHVKELLVQIEKKISAGQSEIEYVETGVPDSKASLEALKTICSNARDRSRQTVIAPIEEFVSYAKAKDLLGADVIKPGFGGSGLQEPTMDRSMQKSNCKTMAGNQEPICSDANTSSKPQTMHLAKSSSGTNRKNGHSKTDSTTAEKGTLRVGGQLTPPIPVNYGKLTRKPLGKPRTLWMQQPNECIEPSKVADGNCSNQNKLDSTMPTCKIIQPAADTKVDDKDGKQRDSGTETKSKESLLPTQEISGHIPMPELPSKYVETSTDRAKPQRMAESDTQSVKCSDNPEDQSCEIRTPKYSGKASKCKPNSEAVKSDTSTRTKTFTASIGTPTGRPEAGKGSRKILKRRRTEFNDDQSDENASTSEDTRPFRNVRDLDKAFVSIENNDGVKDIEETNDRGGKRTDGSRARFWTKARAKRANRERIGYLRESDEGIRIPVVKPQTSRQSKLADPDYEPALESRNKNRNQSKAKPGSQKVSSIYTTSESDDSEEKTEKGSDKRIDDDSDKSIDDDSDKSIEDDGDKSIDDDSNKSVDDDSDKSIEDDIDKSVDDDDRRDIAKVKQLLRKLTMSKKKATITKTFKVLESFKKKRKRSYKCNTCKKMFRDGSKLKKHKRQCKGLECERCKQRFVRTENYGYHAAKHSLEDTGKHIDCQICGYETRVVNTFVKHARDKHDLILSPKQVLNNIKKIVGSP